VAPLPQTQTSQAPGLAPRETTTPRPSRLASAAGSHTTSDPSREPEGEGGGKEASALAWVKGPRGPADHRGVADVEDRSLPPVAWLGLIEGPSGYADEVRGFLRALELAGHEPAARELHGPGADARLQGADRDMVRRQLARCFEDAAVVVHHYAPGWAPQTPVLPGAANVARTMFETDRFPAAWLGQLLSRDEIWVPCEHNREAFERGGIPAQRLRVIGGTLDFEAFAPGVEPLELGTPPGHAVFLSNFEFSARKAWRELLSAWARAFAATDPVCLVLKTTSDRDGQLARRVQSELETAARAAGRSDTAPVKLLSEVLSPADLARLYASADAYVLPSRGEGWGRPYMEALAMGLPTIASAWSGPTEFMVREDSWLIEGELVPLPEDHGVYADDVRGHRWFEPDIGELTTALQEIAGDLAAARRRAAPARARLIEQFGPVATTERLERAIRETAERELPRSCTIRGPFGRNSSLSLVNDRLLAALEAGGRRVHCRPLGAPTELVRRPSISHSWPPDFTAAGEGPHAVILPWEFGHPPADWVERIRADVDRVYVPSEYVRAGYLEAGVPPGVVEVIPNGVDLDAFTPAGAALELERRASCTFLFVGGTVWRKGVDLLLDAWEQAFDARDDVQLVIKDFGVESHYRGQTMGDRIRRQAGAPILYLEDELPPGQLPALYRAADALVVPYRGEGFCLPALEAMACGVPVIHTGIGPTSEFVGDGGWAVPARRRDLDGQLSGVILAGSGYVHEVSVEDLVAILRAVAAGPGERSRRGAAARVGACRHGWSAAAVALEESLARLEAEDLRPARRVRPASDVQSRRRTVVYAPDWRREEVWSAAIVRWASVVPADADATLVMPVLGDQAQSALERVVSSLERAGLDIDALPDLALHQQADGDPAPLIAVADAVLLDEDQAAARPPALVRRARRTVAAGDEELVRYAAALEPVFIARAA